MTALVSAFPSKPSQVTSQLCGSEGRDNTAWLEGSFDKYKTTKCTENEFPALTT